MKDLTQHHQAKHGPPVRCERCGKGYSRIDSLRRLIKTLHDENNADDDTEEDSDHCVDAETEGEMMDVDAINDTNDVATQEEIMNVDRCYKS